ncbi:hypothetical protein SUGI_0981190 [Cryptomeria japonica]|uniref:transcription factor bHLH95 n=1 Tax=Cryptomeria japonica TaxID=3369 RepID=UPI0024149B63|nr:transcription factor bHLH95 [Cryptomeria japonica]GLJ46561.1 hypothetical protein SUGI_0981190 [Cryptomeria japonica]
MAHHLQFHTQQSWPPPPDSNRAHREDFTISTVPFDIHSVSPEEDIASVDDMKRHTVTESVDGKAGKNKNESKQQNSNAAKARSSNTEYQTQPEHEIHIWTERERRKKMRNMFSSLHALLPHLPPKADKSTIVDEAISYIRSLQRSFQLLRSQKIDKETRAGAIVTGGTIFKHREQDQNLNLEGTGVEPWTSQPTLCPATALERYNFQTWASPNVVLSVCGEDAQIAIICTPPKQGMLSTIFYILEKHKLDVVTAHISSHHCRSMYMIHAHVNGGEYLESTPSCEEAFKSAIGELMFYF